MSTYYIMKGVQETDCDGTFVRAVHTTAKPIDYGPRFEDAEESLRNLILTYGHKLTRIEGWLYSHIPGVEGVFEEEWVDNHQYHDRIWLIMLLTA